VDAIDHAAQPQHLLYYEWLGSSPGAGYTRTDLSAVEIDFISEQRRVVHRVARHPSPMIDRPGEDPPPLLEREPWTAMPQEESDAIRRAIRSWLDASPHAITDHDRSVGRESAYMLRFTLRMPGPSRGPSVLSSHLWIRESSHANGAQTTKALQRNRWRRAPA